MGFFRDTSISNKTLISPIIMVAALGVVLILGIYGLNKQQSVLSRVNELSLDRTTLVNEVISLSERVQSNLFRISVLKYMKLPDGKIQPIHEELEQGLSDLGVIYGQILNKWPLDRGEKELLEKMQLPLDAFQRKTRQALTAVSKNPSFGVLMVRSAAVPFADFKRLLSQFLDYQKRKIAHAEIASRETVETLKTTIIVIALFTAFIAILITVWIGTRLISRPVRSITDVMGQLAGGNLSTGVGDLNRKDEIGAMARAVEVFRKNAIEKQATEEALRDVKRRNQALLDHSPVCHKMVDLDFNLTYMSTNGYKMLQFADNADVYGKLYPFEFFPAAFRNEMTENLKKVKETGDTITMEALANDIEGNEVWLDSTLLPVLDDDGRIDYITVVSANTTQRKLAEKEKEHLEGQLNQAQKMEAIGTLAGGVAHEFNNALMGIMGNIELLKMNFSEDEGVDKHLESMKSAGHRMSRLTAQLLAYAEGGKYQPKDLKMDDFVIETVPILQHDLKPNIRVETHFPKDISYIKADNAQMQMVLSAILTNSNEAMEDAGLIRISAENKDIDEDFTKQHPDLKPGYYVCLTVEDDGKGMDEETRNGIFEPFFTTKFQGRGMGMAAVYGIVRNHNGWISVDSELGKGTTVQIYLPSIEGEITKPKKAKVEVSTGSGTILMIEDEDVVIEVTQMMLEMLGYRVMVAKTGKDAIHITETFDGQIDLALLDIKLPDIDGRNLYPLIMKARSNLKVIVFSGYSIDGPAREILDAGAQDFIQKPFSIATLSEKLKEVLEGK